MVICEKTRSYTGRGLEDKPKGMSEATAVHKTYEVRAERRKILSSYDDPVKAERIWSEYFRELSSLGAYEQASDALIDSVTCDELDVRLDLALTQAKYGLTRPPSGPGPGVDIDSGGFYSNARMQYEESRKS